MVRVAFYGDDFTGSVDALLQLRRTGLDGVLVTSPEAVATACAADADADVVGVAGVARSLPTAALEVEVRPALAALLALRPDVLQLKVCSTADSSPEVGSIGRAIEIGRGLTGSAPVPVLVAQPDFGRWTVFGHHFAAEGGEVHRLDRQPTMAQHPVTPATESDLRRHLGAQTTLTVGGLPWTAYGVDAAPLDLAADVDVLVLDALSDAHLAQAGRGVWAAARAAAQPLLVVGSGGLSRGLGLAAEGVPERAPLPGVATPAPGRTLVLSGSASTLTARQVDVAERAGFAVVDLLADDAGTTAAEALRTGADVVVRSTAPGHTARTSSDDVEGRLAAIGVDALSARPGTRLVVCGGDTSGNVLRRLGVERLRLTATPWGMVALCRADGAADHLRGGVEVALKGGQMGHETLFDDIRSGRSLPQEETRAD